MSTYLVAVLISDFRCKEGISQSDYSNVAVKVCARPNAFNELDLALDSSVNILAFFENFYQVKYPLAKLGNKNKLLKNPFYCFEVNSKNSFDFILPLNKNLNGAKI